MAGGVVIGAGGADAKKYSGSITSHVFCACFVGALGGLLFGYDIGISGTYHS